jgi:hypothetical protein
MQLGEAHFIISRLNGYALTAASAENEAQITLREIDPKSVLQQWIHQEDGTIALALNLKKVIDIRWNDQRMGVPIHIWDNNGGKNQQWFVTINMGLQSKCNNLYIDISGEDVKENSKLIMYEANYQRNQMWSFVHIEELTREILDFNTKRYKHIRDRSISDYAVDVEILNETKMFTLNGFESFVEGGEMEIKPLDKETTLLSITGSGKTDLFGVVSVHIREVDEDFAISFSLKKTLFGVRNNAYAIRFLTEVDIASEKLYQDMQKDKNRLDVMESKVQDMVVSSNEFHVRGRMTRGNKPLLQIILTRN